MGLRIPQVRVPVRQPDGSFQVRRGDGGITVIPPEGGSQEPQNAKTSTPDGLQFLSLSTLAPSADS